MLDLICICFTKLFVYGSDYSVTNVGEHVDMVHNRGCGPFNLLFCLFPQLADDSDYGWTNVGEHVAMVHYRPLDVDHGNHNGLLYTSAGNDQWYW